MVACTSIKLLASSGAQEARGLVHAALARSVPRSILSIGMIDELRAETGGESIWFIIAPLEEWSFPILSLFAKCRAKIVLFGAIPDILKSGLGCAAVPDPPHASHLADCEPAPLHGASRSKAEIIWGQYLPGASPPLARRPFKRFDFLDEWNNLGFGAVTLDQSCWSMAQFLKVPDVARLASVYANGCALSDWSALFEHVSSSILWFNREVGPIDSHDWRLIEIYLSDYRSDALPCVPVISEIPFGYDSAVTMRLDCDEDIESARSLAESYWENEVPMSLALLGKQVEIESNRQLPLDILHNGGSLLSHSFTHAGDWGGDYESALWEAKESAHVIQAVLNHQPRYAVSPFHQTPTFARRALHDAGYEGVVGGIIRNDPDHLMARAGSCLVSTADFVSFSQQCMLHGDCLLKLGDPIAIYKRAFDAALTSRTFFAYLDHPFSTRYTYGWSDEAQRRSAHMELISHIRSYGKVLFCNEDDALDFIHDKSNVTIAATVNGFCLQAPSLRKSALEICVEYKGRRYNLDGSVFCD